MGQRVLPPGVNCSSLGFCFQVNVTCHTCLPPVSSGDTVTVSDPEVGKSPHFCHHTCPRQSSHERSALAKALPREWGTWAGQREGGAAALRHVRSPPKASVWTAGWGSSGPRVSISPGDPVRASSDPRPRKCTKHCRLPVRCVPCSNAAKDLQVGDLQNSRGRSAGAEFLDHWLLFT